MVILAYSLWDASRFFKILQLLFGLFLMLISILVMLIIIFKSPFSFGFSSTCSNESFCSSVYGDGICHSECNNPVCGFDGGDCLNIPDKLHPQIDNIRTGYIGLVFDTNKTSYLQMEKIIQARVAEILRAVIRPAIDEKTHQPVIVEMDEGTRIRVSYCLSESIMLHLLKTNK